MTGIATNRNTPNIQPRAIPAITPGGSSHVDEEYKLFVQSEQQYWSFCSPQQ
jgi:hypothetical protein